jgi:hypothetical protein
LTASTGIGQDEQTTLMGFTDFLGKPFKPEALFSKLALHGARQALAASPPVEAQAWEQGASASVTALPRFDLVDFRELAGGDPQTLVELGTIAIQTHEEYKQVLEAGNRDDFDFQHHKIKPTLDLLQAHALRAALEQGKTLLARKERDPVQVTAAIQSIQRELEVLVEALKREIQKPKPPRVPSPLAVHKGKHSVGLK